ncbi:MAG: ROK family protein, partial [Planctomycetes bacterium]|nr:ROK family protein [Planctomycetota bacterium]
MEEYFWGIDIGGTNVRIGLIGGRGQLAAQSDLATQVERGPDSLADRISQKCSELLAERSIPSENVKAAGIGCPGLISKEEGKICTGVNFPGFDNFHIRARLSEKLHCLAMIENDANCICWGEFQMGAGREVNDMVLLTLGTGIGGGVISQGELLGGARGNGSELGHMIIYPDGRKCSCGQRGCLEAYASASHTIDRAIEALDHAETSSLMELHRRGSLDCKDIFDHARRGDILAKRIVEGSVQALALAMVSAP